MTHNSIGQPLDWVSIYCCVKMLPETCDLSSPGSCAWESGFGLTRSPAIGSHKTCQDDVTRLKSLRDLDSGQDIIYMAFKTAWLRSNSCLVPRKLPSSDFPIQSMTPPQSFQLPRQKKKIIGVILYCQGLSDHQGQQRFDLCEARRKSSST